MKPRRRISRFTPAKSAGETPSTLGTFDELVEHRAPRNSNIAAVITATTEAHDATARELVRKPAQTACSVRMRFRRVLQMRERIACNAVRSGLEQDEVGFVLAQMRDDA